MYHGSNTMWSKYTTNKGKLVKGAREDGEPLKPGTAVFKVKGTDYYHVGLFIGGKTVIEARGTQSGVVSSDISTWHTWGELVGVDYGATPQVAQVAAVAQTVAQTVAATIADAARSDATMSTTNAVVIANGGVNMRSEPSTTSTRLVTIPKDAAFTAEPHDDTWLKATYNGKTGYVMSQYVQVATGTTSVLTEEMQIIANIERELARLKTLINAR